MSSGTANEVGSWPTPEHCIADFCLIPIGTPSASVSKEIADVQRLLKLYEGKVTYTMHSAGTTVEGPWDTVMQLIGQAHSLLHGNGVPRVQTDIRVGTRTDKKQTAQGKVKAVEDILRKDTTEHG